ncbi:hypothetical protein K4K53_011589 [Colletotrichum sp. SAR 10_77]|nr:hypothetical protein K4K53_011589 [Colletotrichum sp. SAR 10_77]KAJ4995849.1 hypothetical protein K4K48_009466 [Colletotrichum sp. SAR 10_66]
MAVLSKTAPVWADNRQALCDSVGYYKAHESSMYTNSKIARGILINKHVSVRDMLSAEVVVTTIGGGRKKNDDGVYVRTESGAATEGLVKAAIAAKEQYLPIAVILGDQYPLASFKPNHVYNVLDFFSITDIWSEVDTSTSDGVSIWKIFSQAWTCLNGRCDAAFVFASNIRVQDLTFASSCAAHLAWCRHCHEGSKTIFADGWTCLNKTCEAYFEFPAGVVKESLTYSENFLQERTNNVLPAGFLLKPNLPGTAANGSLGTEKYMRVGMVCPKCGCCSRRKFWTGWAYEASDCDFVLDAKPAPYPLSHVHAEEDRTSKMVFSKPWTATPQILQNTYTANGYTAEQYLLPDPIKNSVVLGSVTVFRSTRAINAEVGGPDDMWLNLLHETATNDFGLQRKPAIHPNHPSEKLTRHFMQNWGAPYKFAVAVASKPFSDAPNSIIGALKRMQWAGRITVDKTNASFREANMNAVRCGTISEEFVDFNEVLSLGYMEQDRISFHDDGEDTLGPTVATLSLGSPAQMLFRSKKKYMGVKKDNLPCLKFPVRHGDMVVMHGTRIHQAYEHSVDPKGMRRFALTSRNIVLDTLDEEKRADAIQKSILPDLPADWDYPKPSQSRKRANDEVGVTAANKKAKTKA